MKIEDFFDQYDLDHLEAYRCLQNTGQWPKDFIPQGTEFDGMWQVLLMAKMSKAWMEFKLTNCCSQM